MLFIAIKLNNSFLSIDFLSQLKEFWVYFFKEKVNLVIAISSFIAFGFFILFCEIKLIFVLAILWIELRALCC